MPVSLKYGRHGSFSWDIDPKRVVVQHDGPGPCSGFANKVRKALTTPLDFPSLVQVYVPGDRVVVALDRRNGETLLQPAANLAINEGDGVAIVGRSGRAQAVESVFSRPSVS